MINTSLKKLGFFSLPLPSYIWFLPLTPHSLIPLASSISCYLKFTAGVRGVKEHISYLPLSTHMQQKVESGMHSISFFIKAKFHFTI